MSDTLIKKIHSSLPILDIAPRSREETIEAKRLHSFFDDHYLPSIDADWSQVRAAIDMIKANGVSDMRDYFAQHPSEVSRLRQLIVRRRLNAAALAFFQADSIEAFEAYVRQEVGAIDRFEVYRNAFSAFDQGERCFEFEGKEEAADGSILTTRTKFVRIGDGVDDWSQVLVTIEGMAVQPRLGERDDFAEALSNRKISGGVAHEFNTILTIIQGCAELISPDSDIDREMKGHIVDAVARGARVTYGLLSYSRNQRLKKACVSVEALIEAAIKQFEEKAGGVSMIRFQAPEDLWRCQLDARLFTSSVVNLLTNAQEAMSHIEHAKIEITCENLSICEREAGEKNVAAGDYVAVNVTDRGHGMSETVRSQAFDPFFTTKPSDRCAGIGLSAVHGFVSQSKGFIDIISAPSSGTTIVLCFPSMGAAD